MITIEANAEEVAALRQLLHRAVLHSGMQAAEAAVHWSNKIAAAEAAAAPRSEDRKGNGISVPAMQG